MKKKITLFKFKVSLIFSSGEGFALKTTFLNIYIYVFFVCIFFVQKIKRERNVT